MILPVIQNKSEKAWEGINIPLSKNAEYWKKSFAISRGGLSLQDPRRRYARLGSEDCSSWMWPQGPSSVTRTLVSELAWAADGSTLFQSVSEPFLNWLSNSQNSPFNTPQLPYPCLRMIVSSVFMVAGGRKHEKFMPWLRKNYFRLIEINTNVMV